MFCSLFAQVWIFGGTHTSLTTSCSHGVSFCITLYVISALNSRGLYFCCKVQAFAIFSGSSVEIIIRLFSLRSKGKEIKILF